MEKVLPQILSLGVDPAVMEFLSKEIPTCKMDVQPYDLKYFEAALTPSPVAIFCGLPKAELEMQVAEVAQALRMIYNSIPIYFVSIERTSFNRKQLQKNGFTDAFLMPSDQSVFIETIQKMLSALGELKVYRSVRLMDIPSENVLGFDLYLHMPANNKYVKYASSTDVLSEKRLERLHSYEIATASVSEDQMKQFYDFTAAQLSRLGSSNKISETQKKELRENAVRDLFTGIFGEAGKDDTIDKGRAVMNDCQEVIKSYILNESESKNTWFDKIMNVASAAGGAYNHASNVSTYAALFSIGLGIGKPDEIALAALLHDIGMADIPLEIAVKSERERTPEETKAYQRHVMLSVNMLKEKKLMVPENVFKIIAQHHERFDGKGYPDAIPGHRFMKEAQILAIADQFDYLTKVQAGKPAMMPMAAMEEILRRNSASKDEVFYDPQLLLQISNLFHVGKKAA